MYGNDSAQCIEAIRKATGRSKWKSDKRSRWRWSGWVWDQCSWPQKDGSCWTAAGCQIPRASE